MRHAKSKGGYSIGIFDLKKNDRDKVYQLYNDGRINFYAPAIYTARDPIYDYIKETLDDIASIEAMKTEHAPPSDLSPRVEVEKGYGGEQKAYDADVTAYGAMAYDGMDGRYRRDRDPFYKDGGHTL